MKNIKDAPQRIEARIKGFEMMGGKHSEPRILPESGVLNSRT
jgi:hypothetical protein